MAELLVMRRSQVNATSAAKDSGRPKRGDVIAVEPDGHRWGTKDQSSPNFEILKLPNVTVNAASVLLSEEVLLPGDPEDRPTQLRAFSLDVDSGPLSSIFRRGRTEPHHTLQLSDSQLLSLQVAKPRRTDV